ncbi:MAG: MGMT family protein [Propionibacteriales bacterium]|nr:MGMT family protein [Propionibacteriales bacterium]
MADEEYVECVLALVEQVPRGRVTTYGLIAEVLQESLGRGGPRTVAAVMASDGESVTWWRVVRADGTLPQGLADRARPEYLVEGTPLTGSGAVDVRMSVWLPGLGSAGSDRP